MAAARDWLDRWHVNPSLAKDYDAIDGLRGLAILMVVAGHLIYINPESSGATTRLLGGFINAGGWGVIVFFTLSGFLISHPFWKRKIQSAPQSIPRGYAGRRFWKIYPPLALSVILLTPIYVARTHYPGLWATAGKWLIGWPLVQPVSGAINPVMWSLIVEAHFYIVLPFVFVSLRRLSPKTSVVTVFLIMLLVPTAVRWWNLSRGVQTELFPLIKTHFPTWLDAFAFGILLAGLENLRVPKKSWARWGDVGLLLLLASMLAKAWFSLHPFATPALQEETLIWGVKIASALMLCYIADPTHPRTRLLSTPWLRWCGLISYEWYLFHQPMALWIRDASGPAQGNLPKYLAVFGTSLLAGLLVAILVYRFFSLPILKFGRARHTSQ